MNYDGIDLSQWDSRTQEIVRQHNDLDKSRYDGWLKNSCNGNHLLVEHEYLRHIGVKVMGKANSLRRRNGEEANDDKEAIKFYEEALGIFNLMAELGSEWKPIDYYVRACNASLSTLKRS